MYFVIAAGDMFWTGQTWTWELTEAKRYPDVREAENSVVYNRFDLSNLFSVRAYLENS